MNNQSFIFNVDEDGDFMVERDATNSDGSSWNTFNHKINGMSVLVGNAGEDTITISHMVLADRKADIVVVYSPTGAPHRVERTRIAADPYLIAAAVNTLVDRVRKGPGILTHAELGAKGGRKTAERGPDHYKKIAGMRKTHAGGRPKRK